MDSQNYNFRKAAIEDLPVIWEILQSGIARRKADGSNQWQDGYPNPGVIEYDIKNDAGYVLVSKDEIIGYLAILINNEPAYKDLKGKWLTNGDFVVFHRVAIADSYLGQGWAKKIFQFVEQFALEHGIHSIKVDTNFDNVPMLRLFERMGYQFCGEVFFRGDSRRAFEKVLPER